MPAALPGAGPKLDRRAIGLGLLVQVVLASLIIGTALPFATLLVLPVVGSVTVGLTSRNFDEEYFDGAIAAGLAPVLTPIVGLVTTWLTNPGLSAGMATSIGSVIFSVALPVVLLGITISAGVGAVLSYQTASVRRRARVGIELQ